MYENIIIIPYRNRRKQLDYFIEHSVPILEKCMTKTKIVVIEQSEGKLFNRGCLLNIGFKEFKSQTNYFITHDVDINPTELLVQTKYNDIPQENEVMGIFTSVCDTLGGIIKISSENIHKINGFPNNFWGWGAEDKALQNRAELYGVRKTKFLLNDKSNKSKYLLRFDDINDRNPVNNSRNYGSCVQFKKLCREEQVKRTLKSGLNNVEYTILSKTDVHPLVQIIKVEI